MSKFFALLTAVAALAMVALNLWGPGGWGTWAKMTASTGFVCLAVSVGALRWNYGRIVFAGLILSWWGDWFLSRGGDRWFLMGLVAFLAAHVAYCAAFIVRGIDWRWSAAATPAVAAATGGVLLWISPHVGADMTWPVRAYTAVISAMVVLAWGAKGAGGPWSIPLGATLFYLSDIWVAAGQFDVTDFPNFIWGLPFYFVGQLFLAHSAQPAAAAPPAGSAA